MDSITGKIGSTQYIKRGLLIVFHGIAFIPLQLNI